MPEYLPLPLEGLEQSPKKAKIVQGWPDGPKRLQPSYRDFLSDNFGNFLAILFSIFVMVYAGLVRHFDSARLEDLPYDFLREVANLGPSVFPIVFAAVVAKNLRTISLWQLEKGQGIGVLDQLLGSTSVLSTIITQFQLRAYGPVGISLIFLWIISPLGGQATLRILDLKHKVDNTSISINYPTMNYTTAFDPGYASDSYALSSKTTFFTAAIMSPASVKNSSVDLWGNVKIPSLEALLLTSTDAPADPTSWITVPPNASYTSLVGIPLGNVPPLSGASMYVELNTSYWTVACQNLTTQPRFTALRDNDAWFGPPIDEFPGATSVVATGKQAGTRQRLLYESRTGNCTEGEAGCVLHAECTYAPTFLAVGVNCTEETVSVLRIRNASSSDDALTAAQRDARANLIGENLWLFAKFFTTAFNSPNPLSSLQYYLQDPDRPWSADNGTTALRTAEDVPPAVFAFRLEQLMNSLWTSLIMDYLLPVGRVADLAAHTDQVGNRTAEIAVSRDATVQAGYQALRCDLGWLVVVFVAALVVFAVSAAGIVLGFVTTVPELRMNASTMVRLSPYAGEVLAAGGTALGDGERGRLLKGVRVRLGDVQPDEQVGRISVAAVGEGLPRTGRVRAGRLYE
ncbi:hypothetical protein DIS24_g9551 [Lasiodiplodia hormozganensis]|uniref:Uncharacterized protein n=1 Tax=Lasiodiplodia hormozganensis TaxID=869390 RepID=A0AA40CJ31_9PEZI|nr:hypothetical protein DIS24_g9551 [Lasiodiplodia hormozganensis]